MPVTKWEIFCFQDMCDCAKIYADEIHQKLIDKGYYDDEGQFDVTEQVWVMHVLEIVWLTKVQMLYYYLAIFKKKNKSVCLLIKEIYFYNDCMFWRQ